YSAFGNRPPPLVDLGCAVHCAAPRQPGCHYDPIRSGGCRLLPAHCDLHRPCQHLGSLAYDSRGLYQRHLEYIPVGSRQRTAVACVCLSRNIDGHTLVVLVLSSAEGKILVAKHTPPAVIPRVWHFTSRIYRNRFARGLASLLRSS